MNRAVHAVRGAVAALAVLVAAGCGVASEDEPQPVEDTSTRQPPAVPSVDTAPGPTPTMTTEPPSSRPSRPASS
jgi:hypothetical protein